MSMCRDCKWWRAITLDKCDGACCYNPPIMVMGQLSVFREVSCDMYHEWGRAVFPTTCSGDLCSKWEQREGVPAKIVDDDAAAIPDTFEINSKEVEDDDKLL